MVVTVVVMAIGVVVVVLMDGDDDDGDEGFHVHTASPVALTCVKDQLDGGDTYI